MSELARPGVATVYEAAGREGLIDVDLHQIVPGTRAAGPARPVRCGQGDNLMRARWIRVRGATKDLPGTLDEPIIVGGQPIDPGDLVVLDADGAVVVAAARVDEVLRAVRDREERERVKRAKLQEGALSYDLDGLRERVE